MWCTEQPRETMEGKKLKWSNERHSLGTSCQMLFPLPSQLCFANHIESNGCNQGILFMIIILFYSDFSLVHLNIKQ